jgi:hypothetical protein
MKVFLVSKSTDFVDCELISIALVTEDGRAFHAERPDFRPAACCACRAVLPHHRRLSGAFMTRGELALRLRAWLGTLPEIVIACVSVFDWELFVDALDDRLAPNIAGWVSLSAFAAEPDLAGAWACDPNRAGPFGHRVLHRARALFAGSDALKLSWRGSLTPVLRRGEAEWRGQACERP